MRTDWKIPLYVILGAAGTVLAWTYAARFMSGGNGVADFVRTCFASPATAAVTWDISFSALVFWVFVLAECRRTGMPYFWVYWLLSLLALVLAMAVFLLARERHMLKAEAGKSGTDKAARKGKRKKVSTGAPRAQLP
ncbi:MAG: DUF2834 domain-containing protein [Desulfatibacillaceae bacterium]